MVELKHSKEDETMTKRLLALLFALLLIISAVACGKTDENANTDTTVSESQSDSDAPSESDGTQSDDGSIQDGSQSISDSSSDTAGASQETAESSSNTTDNTKPDGGEVIEKVYDDVYIDDVDIREYVVVIPSMDDLYSYYTALNIINYFRNVYDYQLIMLDDQMGESEYEILIGDTDRPESDTGLTFGVGEYTVFRSGNKIVLDGYGVYVGAGMGDIIAECLSYDCNNPKYTDIVDVIPNKAEKRSFAPSAQAENVILMIGDGMGYNHVEAAIKNGYISEFAAAGFTSVGSLITRSQSVINGEASYTDSAAAATALATGYKTINSYIGKDANGDNIQNVRELAYNFGALTAVITTDVITGATPGGFLAHNISRNNTEELQKEIDALIADGKVDYCKGEVDDKITEHTTKALNQMAYSGKPFFMMVEEARIDKRSHDNNLTSAMDKVMWYNDSIIYAATFVMINQNTALIVTADHETGGLTEDGSAQYGYKYTSGNHTNADVPVYALGYGTEIFNGARTENTEIAKFIAKHFGAESFGA